MSAKSLSSCKKASAIWGGIFRVKLIYSISQILANVLTSDMRLKWLRLLKDLNILPFMAQA